MHSRHCLFLTYFANARKFVQISEVQSSQNPCGVFWPPCIFFIYMVYAFWYLIMLSKFFFFFYTLSIILQILTPNILFKCLNYHCLWDTRVFDRLVSCSIHLLTCFCIRIRIVSLLFPIPDNLVSLWSKLKKKTYMMSARIKVAFTCLAIHRMHSVYEIR